MKRTPAVVLPKWLAQTPILGAPRCSMLKVVLALVHVHGKREHGASHAVVVAPEMVSDLTGVPVKQILSTDWDFGQVMWEHADYGRRKVVTNIDTVEWDHTNKPTDRDWKLRRLKVTLDDKLMDMAWGFPGTVKIDHAEFLSYHNRASLIMRMRMGAVATKKTFRWSFNRKNSEWGFGSEDTMSAISVKYLARAVAELNDFCADFYVSHAVPRCLGDRKGFRAPAFGRDKDEIAAEKAACRNPGRHVQKIDFTVHLRRSQKRLEKGKLAWVMPDSYGDLDDKVSAIESAAPLKPMVTTKRPRRLVPPPLPPEPTLFDVDDFGQPT